MARVLHPGTTREVELTLRGEGFDFFVSPPRIVPSRLEGKTDLVLRPRVKARNAVGARICAVTNWRRWHDRPRDAHELTAQLKPIPRRRRVWFRAGDVPRDVHRIENCVTAVFILSCADPGACRHRRPPARGATGSRHTSWPSSDDTNTSTRTVFPKLRVRPENVVATACAGEPQARFEGGPRAKSLTQEVA